MGIKVFVYGSLKEGFGNHPVIGRAGGVKIGEGETKPEYTMINMGYFPGVIADGETSIKGEIYDVENIDPIDALEGHPGFYRRTSIILQSGEEVWMYILQSRRRDHLHDAILDGNWTLKHQNGRD